MIYAGRQSPTVLVFLVLYIFILTYSYINHSSISASIVTGKGIIFFISLIITVLESAFLYYVVWKKLLKPHANNIIDDETDLSTVCLFSVIFIPLILILTNMLVIEIVNKQFDLSKATKRYLVITDKKTDVSYNSKKHSTTYTHYLTISSWIPNEKFTKRIDEVTSALTGPGDPVMVTTKNGLFGFQYYTSFKIMNRNPFPKGTKFPLTEDEAKKILERRMIPDFMIDGKTIKFPQR